MATDFGALVEKYDALATQLAPEAMDLALQATQVSGAGYIITGLVLLSMWTALMVVAWKIKPESDIDDKYVTKMLLMIIASVGLLVPGFLMTIDLWNWVAIWRPDLALTNDIINSLGSK